MQNAPGKVKVRPEKETFHPTWCRISRKVWLFSRFCCKHFPQECLRKWQWSNAWPVPFKYQISMNCTIQVLYWLYRNIFKEIIEMEKKDTCSISIDNVGQGCFDYFARVSAAFSELLITESHISIFPSSGFFQWQTCLSSDDNLGQGTRWIRILIKLFHSFTFHFM